MEEIVYSRSVTKQAMSGRVVDKMQIDRHYRMNELSELYTFTPCNLSRRPAPNMPADEILKALLHQYPDRAFKYHDHDSLLENKPEQDLSEEEIKEAWQLYEQESRGVPAQRPMGPQMPLINDLTASMYNANLFAAASSLDSTAGLFQSLYTPSNAPYPSPFDYLSNLMPFDMSAAFRNPIASTTSKAITSGVATPPSASSLLRTQLNTNNMPFSSNPFNFAPSTSITKAPSAPIVQKRRPSAAKQLPPPSPISVSNNHTNLSNLASLQQRIIRQAVDNPTPPNSSANLSILPDPEPKTVRKAPPPAHTKVNPMNKVRPNSSYNVPQKTGMQQVQQVQQRSSSNGRQVQRSPTITSFQASPSQKLSNGVIQKSPVLQRAPSVNQKTSNAPMQSSGAARTISVASINSINKSMPAMIKPIARGANNSVAQQQLSNLSKPVTIPQNKSSVPKRSVDLSPIQLAPPQRQLPKITQIINQPNAIQSVKPRTTAPQNKIVMQPQRMAPKIVPINSKPVQQSAPPVNNSSVQKSIQMLENSSSPISITKLPLQGGSKVLPKPPASSSSISLHKVPKSGNLQQTPTGVVQRTPMLAQKRTIEVRRIIQTS